MSAISDVVNYFQSLYQSGDIKLAVDIALIVMLIWFYHARRKSFVLRL